MSRTTLLLIPLLVLSVSCGDKDDGEDTADLDSEADTDTDTDADTDAKMAALGVPTALGSTLGEGQGDDLPAVTITEDDHSTLLYTSGTTGKPKGVLFTHGRSGTSGAHFIEALGLRPDDTILAVTPLFHGNAWGSIVTALYAGGTAAFNL